VSEADPLAAERRSAKRPYANAISPSLADCLARAGAAESEAEATLLQNERALLLASAARWRALAHSVGK